MHVTAALLVAMWIILHLYSFFSQVDTRAYILYHFGASSKRRMVHSETKRNKGNFGLDWSEIHWLRQSFFLLSSFQRALAPARCLVIQICHFSCHGVLKIPSCYGKMHFFCPTPRWTKCFLAAAAAAASAFLMMLAHLPCHFFSVLLNTTINPLFKCE